MQSQKTDEAVSQRSHPKKQNNHKVQFSTIEGIPDRRFTAFILTHKSLMGRKALLFVNEKKSFSVRAGISNDENQGSSWSRSCLMMPSVMFLARRNHPRALGSIPTKPFQSCFLSLYQVTTSIISQEIQSKSNYRSISNLPLLCKVFKKVLIQLLFQLTNQPNFNQIIIQVTPEYALLRVVNDLSHKYGGC